MRVTQTDLLDAIETSLFTVPEVPGRLRHLAIPGLLGRITNVPHPLANMVGAARLEESGRAAETVRHVRSLFEERQLPFGWVTGPSDTPPNLGSLLVDAGLNKVVEMAGMALTDLRREIAVNPAVRVRPMEEADVAIATEIAAESFGFPHAVAELFMTAMRCGTAGAPGRQYLAYVEDREDPVAVSFAVRLPGTRILLLGGAATLPEYRGRGVYTSLVARRLSDGRADGCETAVIQAVRTTSAPICRKLGFVELCGLEQWVRA